MIEQVYTLKEVAALAKLSEETIRRAVRDGRLTPIKLGRSVRFRAADVKQWLSEGDIACQPEKSPRAARPAKARSLKPRPDGATAYPWDKRRQGRRS